ncbi:DNA replication licensing factor mcm5-A [Thelohanellus kitauei]|uniref:DNA replication licensing factor MCM5 n=1 Tax=Thelohanellus kitauei TaxID=669202 RepID=A0A0C2M5H7_THEKT|nr:DNA replication licensing factor mcm5-A [Thelohanellus kitauei]
MSGFDDYGVHYTEPFNLGEEEDQVETNRDRTITDFREFIMQYQNMRLELIYRNQLKQNYHAKKNYITVKVEDVSLFKESLADNLIEHPLQYLSLFEIAAKQALDEITYPRPNDEKLSEIQVLLMWDSHFIPIRQLKSDYVSKLVKIRGVVINVSSVRIKAISVSIQCRSCKTVIPNLPMRSGIENLNLPRKCPSASSSVNPFNLKPQCPLDPFYVIPDKCICVDSQMVKLQETPDATPTGEMPRHIQLFCDRNLVECIKPGNKITVIGVYSIKKNTKNRTDPSGSGVGIRKPYLLVVGVQQEDFNDVRPSSYQFSTFDYTTEEIEAFRQLAARKDVYEIISRSIAPSIYGSPDIKKAIACLLFGGSSIKLPDGLTLRGDINVLLLGDPGTAKSQLLKFVEKAAPIAVYTSGKGSSAAGLTASINKDSNSGGFVIEGGAMVLADGGVVCIDEFDKMREDDRVAIHEAMEQQTISIAKAGITTTLNSRCAVLAAANSVFGRWDDLKGSENINFMPTILSRFDMIFIVKDEYSEEKDINLAKHVIRIHIQHSDASITEEKGELSISFLRKYIDYCRKTCGPRMSPKAAERLKLHYIKVRGNAKAQERTIGKRNPIVITVRQLEAISRISEALAKMRLQPFVSEENVEEAIRMFHVSTWDAASRGGLNGAEGFTCITDLEDIRKIETQIKQRFALGTQVSYARIVEDLTRQRYSENSILRVLNILVMRGEIENRHQGKILYRVR